MKTSERVTALVLAAGASSRMGSPKALLPWRGTSQLRHIVETASASCGEVVVVLGCHAELLRPELAGLPARSVYAEGWQEGMAASIRTGLDDLATDCDAVLILLCDQPQVTPELLTKLIEARASSGRDVAACEYAGTLGPPALFGRAHFPELRRLSGDRGAKTLLTGRPDAVAGVAFPDGVRDIDTPRDFESERRR